MSDIGPRGIAYPCESIGVCRAAGAAGAPVASSEDAAAPPPPRPTPRSADVTTIAPVSSSTFSNSRSCGTIARADLASRYGIFSLLRHSFSGSMTRSSPIHCGCAARSCNLRVRAARRGFLLGGGGGRVAVWWQGAGSAKGTQGQGASQTTQKSPDRA